MERVAKLVEKNLGFPGTNSELDCVRWSHREDGVFIVDREYKMESLGRATINKACGEMYEETVQHLLNVEYNIIIFQKEEDFDCKVKVRDYFGPLL